MTYNAPERVLDEHACVDMPKTYQDFIAPGIYSICPIQGFKGDTLSETLKESMGQNALKAFTIIEGAPDAATKEAMIGIAGNAEEIVRANPVRATSPGARTQFPTPGMS